MAADLLARGLAAKAAATVKARSVSVEELGATGSGDDRPAVQRAIDLAIANRIPKVTARLPAMELWCPVRTSPFFDAATDGHPLVVAGADSLELDFGGATLRLRGPHGDANKAIGQTVFNGSPAYPWLGGWLRVLDSRRLCLRNVTVDGGFAGSVTSNADANVSDKGFTAIDTAIERIEMDNVELRNFAGEIVYDNSSQLHLSKDCHFHGSGQSAWNPNGLGRVVATNLQAGRAYQAAEVLGGHGHSYVGGRFYSSGSGGSAFYGGPTSFEAGFHYSFARRDDNDTPPFIHFAATRFESCNASFGSWVRGRIVCVDSLVSFYHTVGHLRDIDLDIETWCDRTSNNAAAVSFSGPADLTTQVPQCPTGTYFDPPSAIDIRIRAYRTALAQSAGYGFQPVLLMYGGLYDKASVRFAIGGQARKAFQVYGTTPAGYALPRIDTSGFYDLEGFHGGALDFPDGDRTYTVAWTEMLFIPLAAGTFNVTLDNAYGYANGQRIRFVHAGGDGGAGNRVMAFARNASGMMLGADRTLRRAGEFLEMEWSASANKWLEAAYFGQGA